MEELPKLLASRRAHKAHLTKLRHKIDETAKGTITHNGIALLKSLVDQLKQKRQTLKELNDKIAVLLETPEELEVEILDAEELDSLIVEKVCITDNLIELAKGNLSQHVSSHSPETIGTPPSLPQGGQEIQQPIPSTSQTEQESQQANSPPPTGTSDSDFQGNTAASAENPPITPPPVSTFQTSRLPKLVLPSFNGNPLEWQSFWDAFRSAVHDNSSVSDIQKFNYLRAQLRDGADRVIAGLPLTSANYAKSVQLLKERFAQPHKIINAHMEALLILPSPTDHLSSLRLFYDSVETHIRGLESLGKKTETYGDILVPIIQKKLPTGIKRNLARQNGNKEWQLDNLRKAILNEIEILEAGQNSSSDYELSSNSTTAATAAFLTSSKPHTPVLPHPTDRRPTKRTCLFCKGEHSPNDCNVVTDKGKRYSIVRDARVCFNCLNRHSVSKCKSRNRCKVCHRKHHTSLCQNVEPPPLVSSTEPTTANKISSTLATDKTVAPSVSSYHIGDTDRQTPVLLKTAVASIGSHNNHISAHILFDEGSQRSFITSDVATKLDLKSETHETISLSTFGGSTSSVKRLDTATIYLKTAQEETIPIHVIIVPTIAAPLTTYTGANVRDLPHLKGLSLAQINVDDSPFTVDILIGADHYWDIVENEVIKGPGPTAAKSKIGYLLSGPLSNSNHSESLNTSILNVVTEHRQEQFDLERFWQIESVGVQPDSSEEMPDFLKYYQDSSITLEDGRYSAKLPWRPEHPPLPSNAEVTKHRTRSMIRKLTTDPEKLRMYNDVIQEQLSRGFIERVNNPDLTNGECHYIPHHAVLKDSNTTPLRIVYDCSFKQGEQPSLNDCLQPGPPLLNDLTGILLRFRLHKYAIATDIEKAFLHVNLDQADRDATRFYWLSNTDDPESEFIVYRFKSVMFGATSSPFILNATLNKHLTQSTDQISLDMLRNLYVDDLASGTSDDGSAVNYYQDARNKMSPVGFNLRSWSSNSPGVQRLAAKDQVLDTSPTKKVLGMLWNITSDTLRFSCKQATSTPPLSTKREVLQETAKVFDPLGLLQPVTVAAKILIQELWKENIDWDDPLPPSLDQKWRTVAKEIGDATKLEFPRRYFTSDVSVDNSDTELHVFADASQKAYGAAAYLVRENQSSLALAKSRVAPTKKKRTLPELELMAALTGARLASYLQEQLQVTRVTLWSDSQIVLHWLKSTKSLKPFINTRIQEVKKLTSIPNWKYCPTTENPSDLLTRGITAHQLKTSSLWKHGPTWLPNRSLWPTWPTTEVLHLSATETSTDGSPANSTVPIQQQGLHRLINPSDFSSLPRLLRVTAYVFRFVQLLQKKVSQQGPITAMEYDHAMTKWVKNRQSVVFHAEVGNLSSKPRHRTTLVRQLRLFLDDGGLLRCGGRIHNAPLSSNTKFPLLLPSKDRFTDLVIHSTHVKQLHAGVNSTLTALRQSYWVPSGRQRVKTLIDKCVTCRKVSGTAYNAPDPPPLPKSRMQQTQPFEVTGVDYTGALYVRNAGIETKVYICLFTCAITRAIHLEVVEDLTVEAFLLAFRRFASRKSLPRKLISDNASTFVSANNELKELFQSHALKETLAREGIEWLFIPKKAPWYGGFWERLIGLTKSTIKKVLGRAAVNLCTLQTIVVEVEAILNDRPLTYVSSDIRDEEALTPAHLLYGRRITSLPHPHVESDEVDDPTYQTNIDFLGKTKHVTLLIQHFWQRWRHEYLTSLREFQKGSGINKESVKVGDVVLIHDDNPRVNWKLALVTSINRGRDGLVRSVNLRTANGTTNRPITRLHPLEVQAKEVQCPTEAETTTVETPTPVRRPQRDAARRAMRRIADWTRDICVPPEDVE